MLIKKFDIHDPDMHHTKLKSMNIFYAEFMSTWLENQEIIFCIWDIV